MSTEKQAYQVLKLQRPTAFWRRVENSVDVGMPDVFYCHRGQSAWIELKVGLRRLDGTVVVPSLRKSQGAWLAAFTAAGGRGILGVYIRPTVYTLPFTLATWHELKVGMPWDKFEYLGSYKLP